MYLCKDREGGELIVAKRGLHTLLRISWEKMMTFPSYLATKQSITVHLNCRKNYTRRVPARTGGDGQQQTKRCNRLLSISNIFDFTKHCMFWGQEIEVWDRYKHPDRQVKYSVIHYTHIINNLRAIAVQRADAWGEEILRRLSTEIDLVAAKARYHHHCYSTFYRKGSRSPTALGSTLVSKIPSSRGGRTEDQSKIGGFEKLCYYLENNDECQYTFRFYEKRQS